MNNNITPQTNEKRRGIVANFASFHPTMLENMRYDLGLYMNSSQLASIQSYYKNNARRDPSLDEIYLFDEIIAQREYQRYPIMKFLTDSPVIAQTYADLIRKYNSVCTSQAAPTASSLANVAREYLKKCGKKTSLNDRALFECGDSAELELLLKRGVSTLSVYNANLGYTATSTAILPGQLIAALSKGADMTSQEFHNALKKALCEQSVEFITGTLTLGKGILRALCQYSIGAFIDMNAPALDARAELTSLCDTTADHALIIIAQENVNALLHTAGSYGIHASVIGSLSSDKCMTVRNNIGVTLSYPLSFISELMTPTQGLQVYPDNADNFVADARAYACRTISENSNSVLAAHSSPATFFNALYTTLGSVSDCVAAGASYKDVCLSFDINQPITPGCNDIAVACLLGAYRAQIEFYIPDTQSRFTTAAGGAPTFTSHAMSTLSLTKPHKYSAADHDSSSLYLLKPNIEQNGLVNFEQLRRMWDYVTALVKNGDILYAAAVSPGGVGATISALTKNTSTLVRADGCTDSLLSSVAPGGILAITRVRLNGIFLGNLKISDR